jgi:Protein of unknown function (DUF3093)
MLGQVGRGPLGAAGRLSGRHAVHVTKQPNNYRGAMHNYFERLWTPFSWWLAGLFTVLTFGSIVWGGFSLLVGAAVYAGLLAVQAVLLLGWGHTSIRVSSGELRAGRATLPLALAGEVRALDPDQSRAMRGPHADPRARLLLRPYLHEAVYVETTGADQPPYWLIGTRRPAELAAAIERSRPASHSDTAAVG